MPAQAWNSDFFVLLANFVGTFICLDESTSSGVRLDVARIWIRVALSSKLVESLTIRIDGKIFSLLLKEEAFVQSSIQGKILTQITGSTSNSEADWAGVHHNSVIISNNSQERANRKGLLLGSLLRLVWSERVEISG